MRGTEPEQAVTEKIWKRPHLPFTGVWIHTTCFHGTERGMLTISVSAAVIWGLKTANNCCSVCQATTNDLTFCALDPFTRLSKLTWYLMHWTQFAWLFHLTRYLMYWTQFTWLFQLTRYWMYQLIRYLVYWIQFTRLFQLTRYSVYWSQVTRLFQPIRYCNWPGILCTGSTAQAPSSSPAGHVQTDSVSWQGHPQTTHTASISGTLPAGEPVLLTAHRQHTHNGTPVSYTT